MPISLVKALGLKRENLRLAIVGAGGKTTAMFRISRQLDAPVLMITTTHIGINQADLADKCLIITDPEEIRKAFDEMEGHQTIFLSGGATDDGRFTAICDRCQDRLIEECARRKIPLLIEADGARGLPLKVPAEHEPAIPGWVNSVLVVAGLQGLNQPLSDDHVHRPERFAEISGLEDGEIITLGALERVLSHPDGGLKRIPDHARRMVFLNQADTEFLSGQAKWIAEKIVSDYECVAIGSLLPEEDRFEAEIEAVYVPIASVILVAGGSERLGQPKALLQWKGETMVHRSARLASEAGLSPVIIVAGDEIDLISQEVSDLIVTLVHNPDWKAGQSTSLKVGLAKIPERNGAVIFQVVDQPGLTVDLLWSLIELHQQTRAEIIQPHAAGSRANPVLFDRSTFGDLMTITGDHGGRALFHRFNVLSLPWHDTRILIDLDTPEDLENLKVLE
jgi:molybdenum cofactor cytidylyltransferase